MDTVCPKTFFFLPLDFHKTVNVDVCVQPATGFSFPITLMLCSTSNIFVSGQKQSGRRWSEQNILTGVVVKKPGRCIDSLYAITNRFFPEVCVFLAQF